MKDIVEFIEAQRKRGPRFIDLTPEEDPIKKERDLIEQYKKLFKLRKRKP